MKKLVLLLFSFLGLSHAYGQISGQLQNEKKEPVVGATIMVMNYADSSFVKGAVSNEKGIFQVDQLADGRYVLTFSALSYDQKSIGPIEFSAQVPAINIGVITLETESVFLEEVTVTSKPPFLEQKVDRLIVNVESSIVASGSTALEVLQKVPGIIVINDEIKMNGRNGVVIYVDGRPSMYTDMALFLKDMPSNNISKIEVITNPGAKFDAAGSNGIINIILKKNANLGTNGNYSLGTGYGRYEKGNLGLSINHRNAKTNLFGNIGGNYRHSFENNIITRLVEEVRFDQNGSRPWRSWNGNFRTGLDVFLNPKHTIGFLVSGSQGVSSSAQNTLTSVFKNTEQPYLQFTTINQANRHWGNLNTNFNYKLAIDTSGQELSFDLEYAQYQIGAVGNQYSTAQLGQLSDLAAVPLRNQQPTATRIFAARLDYVKNFGKETTLELGGKLSQAYIDSDLQFEQKTDGNWVADLRRSNHFLYQEHIQAAYANWKHQFPFFDFQIGLRAERTALTGISQTNNKQVNKREYVNLFPSVFLSRKLVSELVAHLSYSRRIDRPSYQDLNPFVFYLDPYTFKRGNVFLQPQYTDSYKFRLTFANQPFFSLGYNLIHNPISFVTEQNDSTQATFAYNTNLQLRRNVDISIYFPIKMGKKVSGVGGVNAFYNEFQSVFLNRPYNAKRWSANYFLQLSATLPHNLSLEAMGWFQMPGLDGLMRHQSLCGGSLGLQKSFQDGKTKLKFVWSDPLYKYFTGITRFANVDLKVNNQWETSIIRLNLTHSFGNATLKEVRKRNTSTEEERRRVKAEGN